MANNINLSKDQYNTEKVTYLNEFETGAIAKSFMANVFTFMGLGLVVSGIVAYIFANNIGLLQLLINPVTGGSTGLGMIVMFAPLAFILVMNFGFNRLSAAVMGILFLALCIVMGMSLSFIFLVYTAASLTTCFFSAAAMFGVMAVMGYTTTKDLTAFGSIMIMGLIGMFVAILINFFLHSQMLDYVISLVGVLVFTGLTAYKVQMLKNLGAQLDANNPSTLKIAIYGAMSLYITFINLFLSLLRVFGRRR